MKGSSKRATQTAATAGHDHLWRRAATTPRHYEAHIPHGATSAPPSVVWSPRPPSDVDAPTWRDADLRDGKVGVGWDGYVYITRPKPLETRTMRHEPRCC